MRKLLGAGLVLAIATLGLLGSALSAAAETPITVVSCAAPIGQGVGVPPVLGSQGVCAELHRTLVFVGTAIIDNGVNFAGVGGTSSGTEGDGSQNGSTTGGDYSFTGQCVMVDWVSPTDSSAPNVASCGFNTTQGTYTKPTAPNPVEAATIGNIGWDPAGQASCTNSNGTGTSTFTSVSRVSGNTEVWTSPGYTWTNSLDNLRGTITNSGAGTYDFDAKVETAADPQAALAHGAPLTGPADVFDLTDAGCLQKNVLPNAAAGGSLTGLNYILVVGTATWETITPSVF